MLADDHEKTQKIEKILIELGDHSVSYAHNRHLSAQKCQEIGLKINMLENDQKLQDLVLSVHHIYFHTLGSTSAFKIIENHKGIAYIQQAQQVILPQQGANKIHGFPNNTPMPINSEEQFFERNKIENKSKSLNKHNKNRHQKKSR